jgi:hypothetical protein
LRRTLDEFFRAPSWSTFHPDLGVDVGWMKARARYRVYFWANGHGNGVSARREKFDVREGTIDQVLQCA